MFASKDALIRPYRTIVAGLGWFALVLQLWLILRAAAESGASLAGAAVAYISYFTILTNVLVAVSLTIALGRAESPRRAWWTSPRVATALAVYITVVGLIYSVVLRSLWHPTGLQRLADMLLHDVLPVAYVVYWLVFVPKGWLRWTEALPWPIYPLVYALYCAVRGGLTDQYPYPFIDVTAFGYTRVLFNVVVLTAGLLGLSLLFIAIDRAIGRRRGGASTET